jgi:nucleoside-diphosphate-sugar epimerase
MNITVTGGAGFIGHHLVPVLAGLGHEVTVIDNLRRGSFERDGPADARLIRGDIRDREDCRRALDGADAVVHLAAQAAVMTSESDPAYTIDTNFGGTWNVATAARDLGVGHIVFASSREVYGNPESLPVAEEAPSVPRNLYGATKASGEAVLSTLRCTGTGVTVLRFSNVIGSGDTDRVVPRWLAAASAGEPLILFGGDQIMDFVPVETAVASIVAALDAGPRAHPINIGSGRQTMLRELAGRVLNIHPGTDSKIEVLPARAAEVSRFQADTSRMERELGIEAPLDPLSDLASYGV